MTKKELYDLIDSMAGDIDFEYQGIHGSICPFSRTNISIAYGEAEKTHENIEGAMNDRIYSGKCLNDIAEEIEIW